MLVLRRLVTSSAVPVVLAALAAVAACAGSSSGDDSTGGGAGTTVGTGTFCEAETAWVARCGTPSAACDQDLVTNCSALTPLMNADVLDAARDCLESATSCGTGATPTTCLAGATPTVSPTAAQEQVRTDYCTKCQALGSDECEQAFFTPAGPVGQVSTQIVPYSDSIAAQIDACTNAAGCSATFVDCAEGVILTALTNAVGSDTAVCVIQDYKAAASGDDDDDDTDASTTMDGSPTADASSSSDSAVGDGSSNQGDSGSITGGTCADDYEPDNTSDTAATLPELEDSAGTKTIDASISVAGADDDWYYYVGDDGTNFTYAADPYASVNAVSPMEVCVWAKRITGDDVPAICAAGTPTDFPTAGLHYFGCCSNGGTTAQIKDYGSAGPDDSSDIFMRVSQMTSTLSCTDYSLTYAFKN